MKRKFIFGLLCLLSQLAQAQNEPNDCVNAITVCGNGDFASNADGIGNVQEVFGCSSSENNSIWLKINIVQGGTLGFELTPDNQDIMVDYDFWVYGPNVQCGALGNPIRCNTTNPWAAGSPDNHTGMDGNSIVTQSGPGPDGNGYVKWLTVSPGQSYYIVIDRPEGDGGFQIEWTGTATTGSGAFSEPPAANNLGEVRTCNTTPNVGVFDLQSLKSQVNPDLSGNTVNFYASYANAFDGSMPLGDSYSNTSNPQQLFAKVTNTATGCFSIVDLTLRVYPVPTVTVAASATSVCSGSNVTVTFSGTPNAFFNYTVNGGAPQQQQLNASGTFTLTQNITANTVYAVSGAFVTSADNVVVCSQELNNSVTVNVVAPQSVSAQTNSPVCIGEDGVITLTGPSGATVNYTVNGAAQPQATLNGAGSGTITLEALTENTPFEIVSVTSANAPFCTTQLNITGTIITNSSPELNTPAPMNGCGDGGPALFDLESYNDVITDGNPNYVVTYYLSLENANLGEEPLDSPYQAVSMNQTVYVRVQSAGSASCVAFTTLDLITATPPSVNAPAAPLETCDDDYDGLATFDLTALIDEITGNNPNLSVTFHELVTQAETGTPFIDNPAAYTSTVAGTQTVHVRVVDPANSECYALTTVTLVVLERPAVTQVSPYALCDDNNSPDGIETFDLTTRDDEVTGGVAGTTVAYYASQEDLDNNIAIANPANFENTTQWEQQIWAKATSANGCESIMPVTLTVNPLPVVNPNMGTFYACEEVPGQGEFDLTEIAQGVTGGVQNYAVVFYPDFDTAQTGGNTLPAEYLAPSGTIYALLTDTGTNCRVITPVTLEVLPAPIATQPAPIEECGQDNTAVFNLDPVLDQIEAALGNTVTATVHETYNDAFYGGANPVANTGAYSNVYALTTNGVQTLYILVQSDQTECSDIVELQLIVNPRPIATEPEAYALCDNGSNDTDGIAVFDLTTLEAEILGTLNPAQFAVSFYDTDGLIPTPASYASASQVITGRVTNTATGCYDEVDVELIVNPLPQAAPPVPYTLCDLNNPGDEVEEFDLNTKIDEIIGTQDGLLVTFFKDYDEAVAGTGASQILSPESYFNASAVEAIFVRVTVEETGCFRIVLLDVRVEPVPVLVMPTEDELTVCDTNGSGFGVFDLQALVEDMENDGPNLEVTFHYTWQDAVDGNNPITEDLSNYHNVDPGIQILYVRVRNTVSGCVRQEPYMITLRVEEAPQAPEDLEDIRQCDDRDNNGQNNQSIFDLTVQDAEINAALAPRVVAITYHTSLQSANLGMPRIVNPANYNGTHQQTIWVRVEDPDTECFSVTSFQLLLDQPLLLTQPAPLVLCNESLTPNGNDAITEFDLTVKDEEILGPFGIGQGMTVSYYETDPRLDPAAVAIPDPTAYENLGPPLNNPQTLFVKVTTLRGCVSYTTLTIQVLPLPQPDTTPDPLVKCDDNNSPDGMEVFNLGDAAADIRNGDATMVLTYYTSLEDAEDRVNQIINFTAYNTASTTIWVRAEANTGNASHPVCYQIVSFEVIVNMLPELGEAGVIEPYAICEPNTDGIATFDFNTHMDEILGEGVNPDDYTVTFYRNAGDQALDIAMPYIYTNTSSPNMQNILVHVVNNDTGCEITAPLTLLVEEAAIANPITTTFFECDYDGDNDGEFTFDLTVVEPEVLGTQNPATYSVAYYTSLADAEDGVNAIPNPTAYENTLSPDYQMIWVRVTNESTVSGCNDITTLELFVERIPEPVLTADHTTVCIDFVTNDNVRNATIDSGLDATHTFVWYQDGNVMPGETGPTLTVTVAGSYTVIATSATGCVSDPVAPVVIERSGPASPINFGYVVGNPFGENQVITVLVQGYGEYQYSLDNGPWQNSNVFENVSAYPVEPGQVGHIVHVRDIATADPCDDLELILDLEGVSPIDYPNFFTPNGDGYHDYWQPFGLSNQPAVVYIFDRYGKLLKQISTSSESNGWDGTYNGNPMPGDDYWFTIEYTVGEQKREFKGHFALKR